MSEEMTFILVCGGAGLSFGFMHGLGRDAFEWLSRHTYKKHGARIELEISVDNTRAIAAAQEVTRAIGEMRAAAESGEGIIKEFKIGAGT